MTGPSRWKHPIFGTERNLLPGSALRYGLITVNENNTSIFVGNVDDLVWIRVDGRATFTQSPFVRKIIERSLVNGRSRFIIDLAACPMMDSTFMGSLTALSGQLKRRTPPGSLLIVNPGARNLELLAGLGLDEILDIDSEGTLHTDARLKAGQALSLAIGHDDTGAYDRAWHVLEAHEALGEANEANKARFRDVVSFLREELRLDPPTDTAD